MNMTTTIVDGTMTLTYWTCVALARIDSMLGSVRSDSDAMLGSSWGVTWERLS